MLKNSLTFMAALVISSCAPPPAEQNVAEVKQSQAYQKHLNELVPDLIAQQQVAGVGVAVIRNGKLDWSGYYGEQGPGVNVSEQTVFNTASVAKTITAETLIALEAKGLIDFDEPIAGHVSTANLEDDSRYRLLTPRLLLSHRSGLLNWAYEYEDGRLAFDHDPDTRFSYSGAGIELAARYAEAKTGQNLQSLAMEHLLEPAGIEDLSMGIIPGWARGRLATPMDADGTYQSIETINPTLTAGDANSAADDLLVTIPAYARLLEVILESDWLTKDQAAERTRIVTSLKADPIYQCPEFEWLTCPTAFGHGIGWQVYEYGNHKVVKHTGSDAGENAFVYYSPDTKNGAVIFINGANGWVVMTRIIEAIGDEPLIADYYRGLLESVMGIPMPPNTKQ